MIYTHSTEIRVRYGECDQMGYLHHSNYGRYYEVARVECMRSLGIPYGEMERKGVLMPVLNMSSKFKRPVLYDEMVRIEAQVLEWPSTRMKLAYQIFNENEMLVNEGQTDLCFVDAERRRPMRCPEYVLKSMELNISKG